MSRAYQYCWLVGCPNTVSRTWPSPNCGSPRGATPTTAKRLPLGRCGSLTTPLSCSDHGADVWQPFHLIILDLDHFSHIHQRHDHHPMRTIIPCAPTYSVHARRMLIHTGWRTLRTVGFVVVVPHGGFRPPPGFSYAKAEGPYYEPVDGEMYWNAGANTEPPHYEQGCGWARGGVAAAGDAQRPAFAGARPRLLPVRRPSKPGASPDSRPNETISRWTREQLFVVVFLRLYRALS